MYVSSGMIDGSVRALLFYEKLKNVSCEYDRWMVEIQLCKLRDTLDTLFFLQKTLKKFRCEHDRWVVGTQLCKLRDTLDTLIGRACDMFQLKYGVCELHLRYAC